MKKAFTLAEILIVLTIIGVMAVMTIPSLMQNSNSQQKIVLFKKAFNAISNAYATEFATKTPPRSWNDGGVNLGAKKIYNALINQLNVKYYAIGLFNPTKVFQTPDYSSSNWIVAEDGISYIVKPWNISDKDAKCDSKLELNNIKDESAYSTPCGLIEVDIDGPDKGLNKYCQDAGHSQDLTKLNCDRTHFFITSNGISAGNPDCIITGRIISDNATYDATKCQEENP